MKYTWLLLKILNQCTNCKKFKTLYLTKKQKAKNLAIFNLNFEALTTSKVISANNKMIYIKLSLHKSLIILVEDYVQNCFSSCAFITLHETLLAPSHHTFPISTAKELSPYITLNLSYYLF